MSSHHEQGNGYYNDHVSINNSNDMTASPLGESTINEISCSSKKSELTAELSLVTHLIGLVWLTTFTSKFYLGLNAQANDSPNKCSTISKAIKSTPEENILKGYARQIHK